MSMLEFYQQHAISPVKQDVSDLQAHFARRAHLYRSLGLWPMSIEGKRVLEVGPGSGENATYTAFLLPSEYVVVEPNPTGAKAISARFAEPNNVVPVGFAYLAPDIVNVAIADYTPDHEFDVVLCEGLLGLCGSDPSALLEHVAKHVKVGGVLVITCIDAISDCSEVLRRAMAQRYITSSMSLQEKVDTLRPIFAPHLATLKGMTRSVDDWILDNLLNPASIGPTFSIPEALTQLEGRFEVLGGNPRFLMDWRWYKEAQPGNQWAIDSYWRNCHNLLDYRKVEPERPESENRELMGNCEALRHGVRAFERKTPFCAEPIGAAGMSVITDSKWFGRGQQYLSLVRV